MLNSLTRMISDNHKLLQQINIVISRLKWIKKRYVVFCRLEQLAQDIESEYKRFDSWRDKCDNMNQWLTESEKLIRNEEKIGSDIDVLQEQIKDNQVGF